VNLRDLISGVWSELGDPTGREAYRGEVIKRLNIAQRVLFSMAWHYDLQKVVTSDTQNIVSGTATYTIPNTSNYLVHKIVRVIYNGREAVEMPSRELEALSVNSWMRPVAGAQHFYTRVMGTTTPGKDDITLYPTPKANVTNGLQVVYHAAPIDFHESGSYEGVATGGSTTTVVDTGAPFNTTATTNTGFWTGAQIRFTSGNNEGLIRRVTTWAPGTSTFTVATLPTAVAASDTYEIDQVPIIPEHLHHMMIYYAAAGIAPRLGQDAAVARLIGLWDKEMNDLRLRYTDNIEANVPGQKTAGVGFSRVAT